MDEKEHSQIGVSLSVEQLPQRLYANHFLVNHTNRDFTLVFADAMPPLSEEEQAEAKEAGSIKARTVVRLAVSPALIPEMVQALNTHFEKFVKSIEKAQAGEEE